MDERPEIQLIPFRDDGTDWGALIKEIDRRIALSGMGHPRNMAGTPASATHHNGKRLLGAEYRDVTPDAPRLDSGVRE